ncbi:MAG: hypothetical protein U9O97_03570 [Elusimicrobiota bacterium]|nr:hypothetical protein [Elusimicrobiota bacterium]
MVILLFPAVAPALFFIYDLWAVMLAMVVSLPFVFKKHVFSPVFAWILFFIFSGIFVSARSAASFDSFTFVLQSVLYAVFFIAGTQSSGKLCLIPLAALAIMPFFSASNINPNIVSSYTGLLFVLLMISPAPKKLKYIIGAGSLFFIFRNGSWTVIFAIGAAAALTVKKKYLLFAILAGIAAAAFNPGSVMDRFFWWSESVRIFAANPQGIGFFASKYHLAATSAQNTIFAHSFFLQLLAEGGILCLIPVIFVVSCLFKNKKEGAYDFALYAVLMLGVLDLSYHITAHGMIGAFIAGLTQRTPDVRGKAVRIYSAVFKALFVFALALGFVMFYNSRVLTAGARILFSGDAAAASEKFAEACDYPAYPALLSAKAAAYSVVAEKEGISDFRKKSFALQEKALPAKVLKIPAYRDFDAARKTGDLGLLRNSCMKILFLNGVRPGR